MYLLYFVQYYALGKVLYLVCCTCAYSTKLDAQRSMRGHEQPNNAVERSRSPMSGLLHLSSITASRS